MTQHRKSLLADPAVMHGLAAPVIVVIEDDDDIRGLIETILVRAGMIVHGVRTGAEGIALTSRLLPNLVTIDIGLPDADGLDVAAFLRDLTSTRDIPILMISASMHADEVERARSRGAEAYLSKPFRPRELRDKVCSLLAATGAAPGSLTTPQCTRYLTDAARS